MVFNINASVDRVDALPASTPEAQGIPSAAILDFVDAAEQRVDALHSFMLLRHGHVVARGWWSPYRPDRPHMLFSVSKSVTSTAVGLAVAEGRLSVDDPVLPYFPDAAPADPGPHLPALRVRHLLTMTTGHGADTLDAMVERTDGDWARAFFAAPVPDEPGARFRYHDGAAYLLSALVQRVTGERLLDYLFPRLFLPLGIKEAGWETCPRGVNTGGWGLRLRTADVAKFGQLYLSGGACRGRQIVPAEWVALATAHHVSTGHEPADSRQGYGYQFWRCRHGAYRATGAFGQMCVVMPAQDAVLVTTGGMPGTQPVLDLVWEHLLPAMGPAPLPGGGDVRARLVKRLAGLRLPPVLGAATAPAVARVSGRTYRLDNGGEVTLSAGVDATRVVLRDGRDRHELVAGHGWWVPGRVSLVNPSRAVAASGGWTAGDTYTMRVCAVETPFVRTMEFRFDGDTVTMASRDNVGFGPTEHPTLTGRPDGIERAAAIP